MDARPPADDDPWWCDWIPPEEDRPKYTSKPWQPGERRWFRSANIVDLAVERRRRRALPPGSTDEAS
jgi:hypothetical protein